MDIFSYEFDGPVTKMTRYGTPITRDEVVEILNTFVETLQNVEIIAGNAMAESRDAMRIYTIVGRALNYAEITTPMETTDERR